MEILYVEESSIAPYFFPSSELVWNALLSSDIFDAEDISAHYDVKKMYCQTEENAELMIDYCNRLGIIQIEYKPVGWFRDKGDYKYGNTLK